MVRKQYKLSCDARIVTENTGMDWRVRPGTGHGGLLIAEDLSTGSV